MSDADWSHDDDLLVRAYVSMAGSGLDSLSVAEAVLEQSDAPGDQLQNKDMTAEQVQARMLEAAGWAVFLAKCDPTQVLLKKAGSLGEIRAGDVEKAAYEYKKQNAGGGVEENLKAGGENTAVVDASSSGFGESTSGCDTGGGGEEGDELESLGGGLGDNNEGEAAIESEDAGTNSSDGLVEDNAADNGGGDATAAASASPAVAEARSRWTAKQEMDLLALMGVGDNYNQMAECVVQPGWPFHGRTSSAVRDRMLALVNAGVLIGHPSRCEVCEAIGEPGIEVAEREKKSGRWAAAETDVLLHCVGLLDSEHKLHVPYYVVKHGLLPSRSILSLLRQLPGDGSSNSTSTEVTAPRRSSRRKWVKEDDDWLCLKLRKFSVERSATWISHWLAEDNQLPEGVPREVVAARIDVLRREGVVGATDTEHSADGGDESEMAGDTGDSAGDGATYAVTGSLFASPSADETFPESQVSAITEDQPVMMPVVVREIAPTNVAPTPDAVEHVSKKRRLMKKATEMCKRAEAEAAARKRVSIDSLLSLS